MTNKVTMSKKEIERFNSKFVVINSCHMWSSPLDKDGYGTFYFRKKGRRAHRVAYYSVHGDIPKGMVIDHICRNRSCVNVNHLRCITVFKNTMENSLSVGAINAKKIHCINGHPFDKFYGKQRYCSICQNEKAKRLQKKWREKANETKC